MISRCLIRIYKIKNYFDDSVIIKSKKRGVIMKKYLMLLLVVLVGIIFYLGNKIDYFKKFKPLGENVKIDKILVLKKERKMIVFSKGKQVKEYDISLGGVPVGHKQFEGDKKTPEGIYKINERNGKSGYHRNLGINYPNQKDRDYAAKFGKSAGSLIKIHGLKNGLGWIGRFHLLFDWTYGCIAVTDKEAKELYEKVIHNAEIEIKP